MWGRNPTFANVDEHGEIPPFLRKAHPSVRGPVWQPAVLSRSRSTAERRSPAGIRLVTKGKHNDLLAIFQRVNEKYFDGSVHALVSWGRRTTPPRKKRQTIKLGSYTVRDRLIRLHPALDRRWVPRYFV